MKPPHTPVIQNNPIHSGCPFWIENLDAKKPISMEPTKLTTKVAQGKFESEEGSSSDKLHRSTEPIPPPRKTAMIALISTRFRLIKNTFNGMKTNRRRGLIP